VNASETLKNFNDKSSAMGGFQKQISANSYNTLQTGKLNKSATGEGLDTNSAISVSVMNDHSILDAMNITIQHEGGMHNQSMDVIKTVDVVGLDESHNNYSSMKKRVKVSIEPKTTHKEGRQDRHGDRTSTKTQHKANISAFTD
jgi:hypothetical protein